MTGKGCILKPRVSYKKIPKKCFEICKNISHRQTRRKRNNRKMVAFKSEAPSKPIIQIEPPPTEIRVDEDEEESLNKEPNEEEPLNKESNEEEPLNKESNEEEPLNKESNEEASNEEPSSEEPSNTNSGSIINSIQKTAYKIFGLSPSSNEVTSPTDDIKNGGKSSKKRKSKRNKLNKTNKRTK